MYWYKVEVFNNDSFIGSFYTANKSNIKEQINEEFGANWTRYVIE